jgi:hypothetical protein
MAKEPSIAFPCHSERSEESNLISPAEPHWILRYAQNDKPFKATPGQAVNLRKKLAQRQFGKLVADVAGSETTPGQ